MTTKILPVLLAGLLQLWNSSGNTELIRYSSNGGPTTQVILPPFSTAAVAVPQGFTAVQTASPFVYAWTATQGARVDAVDAKRDWFVPVIPESGFGIVNPNGQQVNLDLTMFYAGAGVSYHMTAAVPASTTAAFWLNLFFGFNANGTLHIVADQPIVVLTAVCPGNGQCMEFPQR